MASPEPATDGAVIDAMLTFEAGTMTTVAATNNVATIEAQVIADAPAPVADQAQVRVVHLSADAPAVDVAPDGAEPIVADLAYPSATDYLTVPAGDYDLEVRPAGTMDVALQLDPVTLAAGTSYSVFAIGSLAGGTLHRPPRGRRDRTRWPPRAARPPARRCDPRAVTGRRATLASSSLAMAPVPATGAIGVPSTRLGDLVIRLQVAGLAATWRAICRKMDAIRTAAGREGCVSSLRASTALMGVLARHRPSRPGTGTAGPGGDSPRADQDSTHGVVRRRHRRLVAGG